MYQDNILEDKLKEHREQNKASLDPLMQEIFKLKELVIKADIEMDITTPQLFCIKGVLRWDDELEGGLVDLTVNQNYFNDKKVKGVKSKQFSEKIDGKMVKNVKYQGLQSEDMVGFVFFGKKLEQEPIKELLLQCIKPMEEEKAIKKIAQLTE